MDISCNNWMLAVLLNFFARHQSCLLCKQASKELICDCCQSDLAYFDLAKYQHNLLRWPKVSLGLKQPNFDQLLALSDYCWPLSQLLTELKFSGKVINAAALARLFHKIILAELDYKPDYLLPVPLHWSRLLARKYNQSELIAKHLSNYSGIPLCTDWVSRCKATAPQTKLSATQRTKNLKQAFRLEKSLEAEHLVIFDDVVTTGATVNAISALLKSHKPNLRVDVWSICLTLAH